jgi:hypothetical protein
MPRDNVMSRLKGRARRGGGKSGSFRFFTSKPFWYLVILFVAVALIAIFHTQIND